MTTEAPPTPPPADAPPGDERIAAVTRENLIPIVSAGVVVGLLTVVLSISTATLVYGGELVAYLPNGIGLALLSTAIVGTVFVLVGSLPGTAAFSQLAPGAILAVVAVSALGSLPVDAAPITAFMTAVALIALTTMAAGAVFLAGGLFKLGSMVRYLPYPVVGGFVAGTGWLLLSGGIKVMSDVTPSASYFTDLLGSGAWARWLPGVVLAGVVLLVTGRTRHPLAFPALIVAAVAGFYLAMALSGGTPTTWRAGGLLLGPFPDADLMRPLRPADLQFVDWAVVTMHVAGGATVIFMSLLGILFNATALEQSFGRTVDLNQELRAAGLGNLLAGSLGGMVGYQALSLSMLNHRLRGAARITPLISVGVVVVTIAQGATVLEFIPTMVVGGVLAYLGLTFLIEWVYTAFFILTRLEYAVVVSILVAIVGIGFLPGVGIGLVLTVALFVATYSRIDVVRHALTLSSATSRVSWSARERAALAGYGERVVVLQLQGFLFFGSANSLVERIERRLAESPPLDVVICDFRHVSGIDATAAASLAALARLSGSAGFTLLLAELAPALARRLERAGVMANASAPARILLLETLDAALEWCERRRIEEVRGDAPPPGAPSEGMTDLLGLDDELRPLIERLERIDAPAGARFIVQGDASDALFLVAAGQVTARLETPEGVPVRLETMHGGNLVGEIGFYTGGARGASVIADEPTTLYRLTRADLEALGEANASEAAALHRFVARRLAARVAHLQNVVGALQR